jgi:hypothetical protein
MQIDRYVLVVLAASCKYRDLNPITTTGSTGSNGVKETRQEVAIGNGILIIRVVRVRDLRDIDS